MSRPTDFSPELLAYLRDMSLREDGILRDLRRATSDLPTGPVMQAMAEEGQLLELLVALTDTWTIVELGTSTGYRTLCMARALPPDGRLVTCEITDRLLPIAASHWVRAEVAERIEVRTGEARTTLADLLAEFGPDGVDLVFVDADKASYGLYYEQALELVRPGGLIVLNNTVYFGRVIDDGATDPETVAVRGLNARLRADDRVDLTMLPMADGLTLARKRIPDRRTSTYPDLVPVAWSTSTRSRRPAPGPCSIRRTSV